MKQALAGLLLGIGIAFAGTALAEDFPVTVTHEFGDTTLARRPERIVSVGVHEQDFLYALGLAPVGVHEWFGDYPYATWPWAEEARKAVDATPEVLKGFDINIEWVAAQKPDLIVASYYGDLDEATYELLSAIAPTISAPKGYPQWGAPWDAELRLIAQATGTSARAEGIIADIEGRFAAAKAKYPELQGRQAAVGYDQDGMVRTYNSADTSHRFLAALGLVIPKVYDEIAADRGHLDISPESLSLIEIDAFVWPDGPGSIGELSVYKDTTLHKQGRDVDLGGGVLSGALSFQTPLALGYLIDTLPPMLAAAVDGNPATVAAAPPAQ